jgi:hypothetical protein
VRRGSITGQTVETTAPVSVRNGGDPGRDRTTSVFVSVNTGPHVAAVTPAEVRRGNTFTLTLIGLNLDGATAVRFINESGALDAGITVTDVSVSPDGTTLTATVTVSPTAAAGRRFVSVTTPLGVTLREDLGFNAIKINL